MLFDNPVEKVAIMLKYMTENNILPECECVSHALWLLSEYR
jgi:hypothetical protein